MLMEGLLPGFRLVTVTEASSPAMMISNREQGLKRSLRGAKFRSPGIVQVLIIKKGSVSVESGR
jgi:hypothetical protein